MPFLRSLAGAVYLAQAGGLNDRGVRNIRVCSLGVLRRPASRAAAPADDRPERGSVCSRTE
jgi:hypothetical protein